MDEERLEQLRASLNAEYDWPVDYMFKFIMPNKPEVIEQVLAHFPKAMDCKRRASSGGKYISLTISENVDGPDLIFSRYTAVSSIQGVMAL